MGNSETSNALHLKTLLPGEIHGWEAGGEDQFYDPQTIFDYIDGAGEVYRSYNFKGLLARRYVREGHPDIYADLFDMGNARDAFGVFTHDREGEDAGIGQTSVYKGGLLSFWKGPFFVSLYAEEETPGSKDAVLALGRKVDSAIAEQGELPSLVSFFPPHCLEEESIRYFHTHLILNYHFFVSDKNILLLDKETEAALGTYSEGNEKFRFLLVRYPDASKAQKAFRGFVEAYMPEAAETGLVRTENQKWTGIAIAGDLLAVVFDAPTALKAKEMVNSVNKPALFPRK